MRKRWIHWILPLLFCAAFIYGRVIYYGPMNDSVSTHDSESYFEAARMDFPSLEYFEQMRSATLPLIIRICNPSLEHELTLLSEPYFNSEPKLAVQPGTENIIQFQTILSIVCWVLCALLVCSCLKSWFSMALASLLILLFAFVPQVADWDSILISESVSFSLFALMLGLLLKLIPNGKPIRFWGWLNGVFFLIVSTAWVFTRDTNAWFILLSALVLIISGIIWWISRSHLNAPSLLCGFILIGLFIFQQQSFQNSERWLLPFLNNMTTNVLPYPERVAFFEEAEMPVDEKLLAQSGSAEYNKIYEQDLFMTWAKRFGMKTYQKFLLSMPLWTVKQVYENLDLFFEENIQPFFYGQDNEKPHWADRVGNLLHPLSAGVILIDLLLVILLGIQAVRSQSGELVRWFCFSLILFLGGGLMMSISYLGEVRSIWRHVLSGVMALRLCLWLMIPALGDKRHADK